MRAFVQSSNANISANKHNLCRFRWIYSFIWLNAIPHGFHWMKRAPRCRDTMAMGCCLVSDAVVKLPSSLQLLSEWKRCNKWLPKPMDGTASQMESLLSLKCSQSNYDSSENDWMLRVMRYYDDSLGRNEIVFEGYWARWEDDIERCPQPRRHSSLVLRESHERSDSSAPISMGVGFGFRGKPKAKACLRFLQPFALEKYEQARATSCFC